MGSDGRKKERQRLKRKEKQRSARKAAAVRPLKLVGRTGGQLECYVNDGWQEQGMASILVLSQAPGGRVAYAAFLIDTWCVGLKDAFGEPNFTRGDFEDVLDRAEGQMAMVRFDPAEAKRLVAGAVEFTRRNGFRLPTHFDRWTAIFGNLGEADAANLEEFGIDGDPNRLRYVGTIDFLRKRLIGSTIEDFLRRPDVEWVAGDGTPRSYDPDVDAEGGYDRYLGETDEDGMAVDSFEDDPEGLVEMLAENVARLSDKLDSAIRQWCFANGQVPSEKLSDAVGLLMGSLLPAAAYEQLASETENDPSAGVASGEAEGHLPDRPDPVALLATALEQQPPEERPKLALAMDQVQAFMKHFDNPAEMLASVGIGEDSDDEADAVGET